MPLGQLVQAAAEVAPMTDEYVPALQLRQTEAPLLLPYLPAGHCVQVLDDVAAVLAENVPAGHAAHAALCVLAPVATP